MSNHKAARRYTIGFESSHKQWVVIDTKDPECELGYHYHKTGAQRVAGMLTQRIDLLAALEELVTRSETGLSQAADQDGDAIAKARHAIAQAKGGLGWDL